MRIKTILLVGITAFLASATLCASSIEGRGASFPNAVYKAWSNIYFKTTRKRVSYIATDSVDGLAAVEKGEVDFGASDTSLSPEALEKKKLFVFPTVVGAIDIVYHLEGVKDGELKLSRKALAAIFGGKVSFWDDPLIAKENRGLKLPHKPLKVVVRSDASGSTYNLTYFLSRTDPGIAASYRPDWKIPGKIASASAVAVWANIHEHKNSIGYIDHSYKSRLHMHAAKLENREGSYIAPSVASVHEALAHSRWTEGNYYYTQIVDPEGKGSYPLAASTFLFIPQQKNDATGAVIAFLDWAYRNGDKKAVELGFVPLPETIKSKSRKFWKSQKLDAAEIK